MWSRLASLPYLWNFKYILDSLEPFGENLIENSDPWFVKRKKIDRLMSVHLELKTKRFFWPSVPTCCEKYMKRGKKYHETSNFFNPP